MNEIDDGLQKRLQSLQFHKQSHFLLIAAFIFFALTACGGGSTDSSQGKEESGALNITILDDPLSEQPLSGAFVSLYKADKQTISKTIKTGSDGVADFGVLSSSMITITIAYEDNGQGAREIRTIYNTTPGTYDIYMKDIGCASQNKINANYVNTGDTIALTLEPHLSGDGALLASNSTIPDAEIAQFNNVSVCLDDIQSDGKLTHFVMGFDNTGKFSRYGFKADQTIASATNYSDSIDLIPTQLNWSAIGAVNQPDAVTLGGVRKGVWYSNLGFWPLSANSTEQTAGDFPVADQFPADAFIVTAIQSEGLDNKKVTVRRYETYASSVAIDFTDNEFSSFAYDAATESYHWTLTGNSPRDFLQVNNEFSAPVTVNWGLTIPPDSTTLTLPELPAEVNAWFDRKDIKADKTEILAGEVPTANGYDEYLALAAKTANLLSQSVTIDADMVAYQLADVTNNNGGGNAGSGGGLYGELTLSGDGAAAFPSMSYAPESVTPISGIIAWLKTPIALSVQSFSPIDATKAASIILAHTDVSTPWSVTTPGLTGVPGVSISSNSVTFTNVVVSNQAEGTSVTLNGTLTY